MVVRPAVTQATACSFLRLLPAPPLRLVQFVGELPQPPSQLGPIVGLPLLLVPFPHFPQPQAQFLRGARLPFLRPLLPFLAKDFLGARRGDLPPRLGPLNLLLPRFVRC